MYCVHEQNVLCDTEIGEFLQRAARSTANYCCHGISCNGTRTCILQ